MILVDGATGSGDLVEVLSHLGLPVKKAHLASGDVAFTGRGIDGESLAIGIEVKTMGELVGSLQSERLQGHQLLKMQQTYDRSYLIVEGDFNNDRQGRGTLFKHKKSAPMRGVPNALELEQRLFNLQTRGGLITRHVDTRRDTIRVIHAWYRYWTDKALDEHKSHLAIYAPDMDPELKMPISDFRRFVAMIPGVGYTTSAVLDQYFEGDAEELMRASAAEFAELMTVDERKGTNRRLGKALAERIVKFLHPKRR